MAPLLLARQGWHQAACGSAGRGTTSPVAQSPEALSSGVVPPMSPIPTLYFPGTFLLVLFIA